MTVYPQNGYGKKIADRIFSKYPNRILSISIKIDGSIVLTVLVYFKTTAEIHDMMVDIHSMAEVENAKFAETVDIIRDNKSKMAKTISQDIIS